MKKKVSLTSPLPLGDRELLLDDHQSEADQAMTGSNGRQGN